MKPLTLYIVALGCVAMVACGGKVETLTSPTPTPSATPAPSPAPAPAPEPDPTPAPEPTPAPSPAPSSTPVESNLTANFSGGSCTRPADHLTGSALVVTITFTDGSGSLAGGQVVLNRRYNTGRTEFHNYPIPSEVTLTGSTTSGQMQVTGCPLYDDGNSSTETLTFTDASGRTSNSLSVTVNRPAGAP